MPDEFDAFGQMFDWNPLETAYYRTKHRQGIEKMKQDITKVFMAVLEKAKKT